MGLDGMLRQEEVAESDRLFEGPSSGGWSPSGGYPPPYKTGLRAVRWKESEVQGWIDSLYSSRMRSPGEQ